MSHRSATGNSDETCGDQCHTMDVIRVIGGRRSVPSWKVYGARVIVSALYDSVMFRRYRISNNISKTFLNSNGWTWCRSTCTSRINNPSSAAHRWQEGEAISCIYKIHTTTTLATLRVSRICRVSWVRKLLGKRTRSFSATGKYNKKSQ